MALLHFVFVALLASLAAQAGIPQYIHGQWVITETPQYEDTDEHFLTVKERLWPDNPPEAVELVTAEYQDYWPTTPGSYSMTGQDPDAGAESSVWKVILVVAILLVSVVGTLSVAYYMCVWRGGRIHYQPQKVDYA